MKHVAICRAVRSASGCVLASALLASPLYADDARTDNDATTTMDCQRYEGSKRTECERALDRKDSTAATSRQSDRTRLSRADTEDDRAQSEDAEEDSKFWDSTRERDPGKYRGADMRTVPPVDREDANEELSDPYQVGPGTDPADDAMNDDAE